MAHPKRICLILYLFFTISNFVLIYMPWCHVGCVRQWIVRICAIWSWFWFCLSAKFSTALESQPFAPFSFLKNSVYQSYWSNSCLFHRKRDVSKWNCGTIFCSEVQQQNVHNQLVLLFNYPLPVMWRDGGYYREQSGISCYTPWQHIRILPIIIYLSCTVAYLY